MIHEFASSLFPGYGSEVAFSDAWGGDRAGRGRLTQPTLRNSSLSRKGHKSHTALSQNDSVARKEVHPRLSAAEPPGEPQKS